jgi:hypothetical protein
MIALVFGAFYAFGPLLDYISPSRSFTSIEASQRTARQDLGRLCVPYSRTSFFQAINEQDLLAVHLFLGAGMSPMATDTAGATALELAAVTQNERLLHLLCSYFPSDTPPIAGDISQFCSIRAGTAQR